MKQFLFFLLIFSFQLNLNAQSGFDRLISQGDDALMQGNYKIAIDKYEAAEALNPSKKDIVKLKKDNVFKQMEKLRHDYEKSKRENRQNQRISENLVYALNFYCDRFALIYNDDFYFIDKNGDKVEKLGSWNKAEPFDKRGFAKVFTQNNTEFLLDTFGVTYKVAYDINDLNSEIKVLDLSNKYYSENPQFSFSSHEISGSYLTEIPEEVFEYKQLEVLLLNDNKITHLPADIGNLNNLKVLDLANHRSSFNSFFKDGNLIQELPNSIGDLKNLEILNLYGNDLVEIPAQIRNLHTLIELNLEYNPLLAEKRSFIRRSLPNCKVVLSSEIDYERYAEVVLQKNKYREALSAILKGIKKYSVSNGAYEIAATCYYYLEDYENALKYMKKMTNSLDGKIWDDDYNKYRLIYHKLGDYANAYKYSELSTRWLPEYYRHWAGLSWQALFVRKPLEAIRAAKKSLELKPEHTIVETNLALGFLFTNQWTQAEGVYLKWKGKYFPGGNRLCGEVFLKDIADLEKAGITHPDFEKVKQLFRQ